MQAGTTSEAKSHSNEKLYQGLHAARRQLHEAWGMIPEIVQQLAQADNQPSEQDSDLEGETDEDTDEGSNEDIDENADERSDSVYISDSDEGDGEVTEHGEDHGGETDNETDQEIEDVESVYIIDDDDEEQELDCSCGLMDHDSECNTEQGLGHQSEHGFAAKISEMAQHGYLGRSADYAVPSSPNPTRKRKRSLDSSSEEYTSSAKRRKHDNDSPYDTTMPGATEEQPWIVHGEESFKPDCEHWIGLPCALMHGNGSLIQIEMEIPSVASPWRRVQLYPLWAGVKRRLPEDEL